MKHYLVYQVTNLINEKIYIGIHITENVEDGYMGSGRRVRKAIKRHGLINFKKEILFDFDNPEDMVAKEIELVDRTFIARKDVYNIQIGGNGWNSFDTVTVKDSSGNCFRVHKTDSRWMNGELKSVSEGLVTAKDISGNVISVSMMDGRLLSGELNHVTKGTITVKDSQGKTKRVSTNDSCYLSGELKPIWTGKHHTEEAKRKMSEKNKVLLKGEGNSQYGTCWITFDGSNKKIKKTELESHLEKGWVRGRKIAR